MNYSLPHGQPAKPNLALRAHLSNDLRTVEISLQSAGNQPISRLVSWREVDAQVKEIDYLLNSSWQTDPNPADEAELNRCASELFSLLFDAAASDALNADDGCPLVIEAPLNLQRIPWELLQANRVALGERFAIGRTLPEFSDSHATASGRTHRAMHVASVPVHDLTWTAWEQPAVRAALRRMAMSSGDRFTPPKPSSARLTVAEIQRWLSRSRWLHFAGHAEARTGGRGWVVEPDAIGPDSQSTAVLTPEEVLAIRVSSPEVVFAHGCGTLKVPEDPNSTLCMTDALLRRGTRWLLGTTTPTLDNECRYLVESFYAGIVRGLPIGEALRQARVDATRRCPTGETRWLSYVLYGDPSECFVATAAQASSARRSSTRLDVTLSNRALPELREPSADIDLSAAAVKWGDDTMDHEQLATADARADVASSETDASASEPGELSTGTLPDQDAQPDATASVSSSLALHCQRQLLAAIAGFEEHRDFRTGRVTPARLEECRTTRGSAWAFESFGELRSAASAPPSDPNSWQYLLKGTSDTGPLPSVRLTVDWLGTPSVDEESAIAPATASLIDSHLTATLPDDGVHSERHDIRVIVSTTGFEQDAVARFCDESSRRNLRPGLSVALIDIQTSTVHYRETDLDLMPFLPLCDLSDEEQSVQQVVEHVGHQLPLAASLGARTVAADLQLSPQIVAAGFRVAAAKYGLSLDDLPQHGLVLAEDAGPAAASSPSDDGPRSSRRSKWFGSLLAWLTSLAALWTSLTET